MKELRSISTKTILGKEKVVQIVHNGKVYFLRVTKDDKLILTK